MMMSQSARRHPVDIGSSLVIFRHLTFQRRFLWSPGWTACLVLHPLDRLYFLVAAISCQPTGPPTPPAALQPIDSRPPRTSPPSLSVPRQGLVLARQSCLDLQKSQTSLPTLIASHLPIVACPLRTGPASSSHLMPQPTPWTIIMVGHRYRQRRRFFARVIEPIAESSALARSRLPSLAQLKMHLPIMEPERSLPSFLVERRRWLWFDCSAEARMLRMQERLVERVSMAALLAPSFLRSAPWPQS